ncbi:hypothetical protein K1T71_010141 [Dendrolimus kikuchii]|uniref:Uncharacterized protein n=1 Tax=Dendrolimus kikuchii TaxID=765133 RepID=A0ACC1CR02_9NEOP|nr:hypothetical protein K1T71_010141 [Dendrolimus kikuchii]
MCNRLSTEDQKTILKYSKCLMECPTVTCKNVQAAILEACGQDQASMLSSQLGILDTPPALRSLHSEVRRLQAALDAERFDRNYLQEELARKNLKMDKLMKIKEQYKLEIMDLKAKISLCGQKDEGNGSECEADKSSKLMKQLKEIEDRLEQTQGQLDDVLYERDMYKSKVEDLKKDRDKWLTLSQQETDRILQLTQELEIERRDTQTLKEVVAELRQHNRLNGLDLSQLECDDPETSIQSLHHNISGCSEICANVVEVQLGEERAKIVVLKQQIETLQGQINDLKTIAVSEKQSYEEMLKEKECEINDLKHRINEEFEENNKLKCVIDENFDELKTLKLHLNEEINNKNTLEEHFNCEVIKLNNEVNELEQRLKDNTENARKIIETKINEIQVLHEEKISLLESLTNEINKRDNLITDLQSDLENEKQAKTSMKDSHENKIMKLKEKVLNRNNELVELQNNLCEKSEMIESLHLDLKKEKESKQELIEKYGNDIKQLAADKELIQKELYDKYAEIEQLMTHLNEKDVIIDELKHDLESFKITVHDLTENCKSLETAKANLVHDMAACNSKFDKMCKDINNLKIAYEEEKNKSQQDLDEKNARIDTLQKQLQEEINFKIILQNDMSFLTQNKISLQDEIEKLRNVIIEKDRVLKSKEMDLQEEVNGNDILIKERDKFKADLDKYINDSVEFTNVIQSLKAQHEEIINSFNEQLNEKSTLIEELNTRILEGIQEKYSHEDKIKNLNNEKHNMEKEIAQKSDHITQLQAECDRLNEISEQNKLALKVLEQNVQDQNQKCMQLEKNFDVESSKMILKLNETEKVIKRLCDNSKKALSNKEKQIEAIKKHIEKLAKRTEKDQEVVMELEGEKEELKQILEQEKIAKNTLENEYRHKCMSYEEKIKNDNTEIVELRKIVNEKSEEIKKVNKQLSQNRTEITLLQSKLDDLESYNKELEVKLNTEADCNKQILVTLQTDNEQLLCTLRKNLIDKEQEVSMLNEHMANIREVNKELECHIKQLEAMITKNTDEISLLTEALTLKDSNIKNLIQDAAELTTKLNDQVVLNKALVTEKNIFLETNQKLANKSKVLLNEEAILTPVLLEGRNVTNIIVEENALKSQLDNEMVAKKGLLHDNECLTQQLVEEKSLRELLENEKGNLIVDNHVLEQNLNVIQQKMDQLVKDSAKEYKKLIDEKNILIEKVAVMEKEIDLLKREYGIKKSAKDAMQTEKNELKEVKVFIEDILTEKYNLILEKDNLSEQIVLKEQNIKDLTRENEILISNKELMGKEKQIMNNKLLTLEHVKNKLLEEKSNLEIIKDTLIKDNHIIIEEKEMLLKDIDIEKAAKDNLESEKNELRKQLKVLNEKYDLEIKNKNGELVQLETTLNEVVEKFRITTNLEQQLKHEIEQNIKMRNETLLEQLMLSNKLTLTLEDKKKAEQELNECQKQLNTLMKEIDNIKEKLSISKQDLIAKDRFISKISKEKDAEISAISKELLDEKTAREKLQQELEMKIVLVYELQQKLEEVNCDRDVLNALKKENEELMKVVQETETLLCQERAHSQKYSSQEEKEYHIKVDKDSSSDITQSLSESIKTITDLEKIIHNKNRTITTLQSDITYLKTIMAESESKLLDVTRELEVSNENCQQLSNQLKKIVYQKNEEIAELKKQVNKMTAMENRASQIIKVSAKYQAIILKRIAEIKSNTVLKELTNYGNTNSCDNELRRSLNAGTITMEDLENFLDTTDRHLKRCSDKQIILQKERDRLYEVNKIHESEIINLKKFLTELSVCFSTFNSVKDLYTQKLSRVVSIQRTVRREILNLDGQVTDNCMCKLERAYAAVMQDLSECAMNLERWVERCVSRSISPEKIKQAFSDSVSISGSFQNAGLEVQLEELEKSFQKLLEEVARAQRGEGARDAQSVTVMEVKAEYEDKLNRMKAKMKQLFNEQMSVIKEKQRDEIVILEQELMKARETLARTSRSYEEHIKKLTTELWTVGEKFLMTKDEAEWLKRQQKSGSLMSLQHVHSSGLVPPAVEPSRPSDSMSLRSLPTNNENKTKKEDRGLHMSDEEGEVFDNRWLKELSATPRREGRDTLPPGQRLSELKWRNSLCPPHLKSSYPAETQFAPALDEEDIKCLGTIQGKQQRKEVGITAYKKPGPPTPSKQAGRLSATDSELRESLRVEGDPHASRKTSTPSRLRSLFRSSKVETADGTPRSRRLSNIFRKK